MESERRHGTVLFADVSGFTAMSERMDPEEVVEVVNSCFEILEEAVLRYGGHVDKFEGDCIMAIFGAPTAIENTAKAAVNTAIEMRNCLYELRAKRSTPTPLDIHIGVNSGLVVAGEIGGAVKRDFTVMGPTVNLAARLKDASPKGKIWVGPETYRYTRSDFDYEPLQPLTLKNIAKPVPVYELRSIRERRHRASVTAADRMVFSDLIGRAAELERLQACVRGLLTGQGGIVSLFGEAGLGKSRLVAELARRETPHGVTWLEGRSLSIGATLAFHPFIDLLRSWATIVEDDPEAKGFGKLESAIAGLFGEQTGEVLPFIATLMGMHLTGAYAERIAGIEGEPLEKLVAERMRELLEAMARRSPLVLVFEDLHWADASSLTLLQSLLRLALEQRILFVAVMRPDHHRAAGVVTAARQSYARVFTDVVIEPLDARECDELIRNLLRIEDLPYRTRALIARKAEGNPFYIEEVVRSLIDEGAVEYRDGQFRVTEKIESVVIPGSLQEVIMARIDRLPDNIKQLLQGGAVIGRIFPHRILAAILKQPAQSLDFALRSLKRRQLISERHIGDEIEYVFKHALTQETIYESILQKTRRELHLEVARAIEWIFADRPTEYYGMLAYHFSRADDAAKAEEYLFKAGDEAARSAASAEALQFFQEASRLYLLIHGQGGDPSKKALLQKNIGLALLNRGSLLESIDHFNKALEFMGESIPRGRLAIARRFAVDVSILLARVYLGRLAGKARPNDREILEIRYNRARAQTTADPERFFVDTIGSVRLLSQTDPANIEQACGMYAGAAALFVYTGVSFGVSRRLLEVAKGKIREGKIQDVFLYRAMEFLHHHLGGNWRDEHLIDDELVEQAIRHGLMWDVNTYLDFSCERLIRQGEWSAADAKIRKMAELAEKYGFDFATSNQNSRVGFLALEQGRLEDAVRTLDVYYAGRFEELLNLWGLGTKAKAQLLLGDRAGAAASLGRVAAVAQRARFLPYHSSPYIMSRLLFDVTEIESCLRSPSHVPRALVGRARRSVRKAVWISGKVALQRPEAFRLAGRFHWLLGARAKAFGWWGRSIEEAKRLAVRPELARTYLEVGERLGAADWNGTPGSAYLIEARGLMTELGLERELARLASRSAA